MTTETKKTNAVIELVEKWNPHLSDEKVGAIAERHKPVVAEILELQEAQFNKNPIYQDEKFAQDFGTDARGALTEAMIGGDVGGITNDPTQVAAGKTTGAVVHTAPVILNYVKRAMHGTCAFDLAGVQPTNKPSGEMLAYRAMYGSNPRDGKHREIFHPYKRPDVMFSGEGTATKFPEIKDGLELKVGKIGWIDFRDTGILYVQAILDTTFVGSNADELEAFVKGQLAEGSIAETAAGMATSVAELQEEYNGSKDNPMNEVGFRIDKTTYTTKTRQLKSTYSKELAQDLEAVHKINVVTSLNEIITSEIMLEIDAEIITNINATAQIGKSGMTHRPGSAVGVWDLLDPIDNGGGRWDGERYKALIAQIDRDAVEVGRQTGRGPATWVLASRNVVNALSHTGALIAPGELGISNAFNQDTTKSCFAGVLGGKYQVFIDRLATYDYYTVGFKGSTAFDAGIFYAPYVPLTPHEAIDPKNFNKVIGFSTRYYVGFNPFAIANNLTSDEQITQGNMSMDLIGKNPYFRRVIVKNI